MAEPTTDNITPLPIGYVLNGEHVEYNDGESVEPVFTFPLASSVVPEHVAKRQREYEKIVTILNAYPLASKLVEALEAVEWVYQIYDNTDGLGHYICPECENEREYEVHNSDCQLGNALANWHARDGGEEPVEAVRCDKWQDRPEKDCERVVNTYGIDCHWHGGTFVTETATSARSERGE